MSINIASDWQGISLPSIIAPSLQQNIQSAVQRTNASKRYTSIAVLLVTWDYDIDANFLLDSEILESVFRTKYDYETVRVVLPSGRDEDISSYTRKLEAGMLLTRAIHRILRDHSTENDLIIFHYRGYCDSIDEHGRLTLDRTFLASGEFIDPFYARGGFQEKTRTRLDFQDTAHELLQPTKADVILLMDSYFNGRAVFDHKHSLLAATLNSQPRDDFEETGFMQNLIVFLQEAANTRNYLTVGTLHSALLSCAANGKASVPVWQVSLMKEEVLIEADAVIDEDASAEEDTPAAEDALTFTDEDVLTKEDPVGKDCIKGSPMLHILQPDPYCQWMSEERRRQMVERENLRCVERRPEHAYVKLAVRLAGGSVDCVDHFDDWVGTLAVDNDIKGLNGEEKTKEIVDIGTQRLGASGSLQAGLGCLMFEFYVDMLVWREMEFNDAILFCGYYPELPEG